MLDLTSVRVTLQLRTCIHSRTSRITCASLSLRKLSWSLPLRGTLAWYRLCTVCSDLAKCSRQHILKLIQRLHCLVYQHYLVEIARGGERKLVCYMYMMMFTINTIALNSRSLAFVQSVTIKISHLNISDPQTKITFKMGGICQKKGKMTGFVHCVCDVTCIYCLSNFTTMHVYSVHCSNTAAYY